MVRGTNGRRRRYTPRIRRRRRGQRGGILPAALAALAPMAGKALGSGVISAVGAHLTKKALHHRRRRRGRR